jgi:hypothetical protein
MSMGHAGHKRFEADSTTPAVLSSAESPWVYFCDERAGGFVPVGCEDLASEPKEMAHTAGAS